MAMQTAKAHRRQSWMRGLFAIFSAIVFVVAAIVLYNAFHTLNWRAIEASILQWRGRFVLAALLCSLSFGVVGLIEWRALRWAGSRISISQAFKVSFIANGLAHSLGAAAFVAAAVRGRLYARHGVGLTTSAAVTAFQTATSTSGVVALVGVACLTDYRTDPLRSGMGVLMLGAVALYLLACGLVRGNVRLWAYTFELPTIKGALVQIGLGAVDNALAIGSLFVLLPPKSVTYPTFVGDYAVAYVGGALSGIPGGAGPFEGLLVKLLPTLDLAGLGAAMLGFRLIFNLAPLLGAGVLFLIALAQDRGRISDGVVDMS
jgi:uncharacterized membrane protein YbhN (UPF0104 family)